MELLDIVDENGVPTGKTVLREMAHKEGIRHRTAHLWLMRRKNGILQVLVQKRSEQKDSHPGCYDISSAGHIPAGSDYIPSALRELSEELGLVASPEELIYCGKRRYHHINHFRGTVFSDHQVSSVYVLWRDVAEEDIIIQESELASVRWMDFDVLYKSVQQNTIPNCIALEELDMIKQKEEDVI